MDTVFLVYAFVLIVSLALVFFGSLFLGAASQRGSFLKQFSKDCVVFSTPEFSKKENRKNIFWGIVGVILGDTIFVVSSMYLLIILYLTGNNPEPWTLIGAIIILLILFASHMFGIMKGRIMFAKEFLESCENHEKNAS